MVDQATRLREIAEQFCQRPRFQKPHVITVASGKGGVGKSTVALNIGWHFAHLGYATLLVDGDANLGNLDVMLGVSPRYRLGDVVDAGVDLEDAVHQVETNLSLLAAASGDVTHRRMTKDVQQALVKDLRDYGRKYDYIIIDAPAGIDDAVIGFALQANDTLVITIPEPTAVMDAYALIKMISLADAHVPVKLIVNGVRLPSEGEETGQKLRLAVGRFLQRDISLLGSIPYDRNVSKAITRHAPVVKEFSTSPASRSLQSVAEECVQQMEHATVRRFQTV